MNREAERKRLIETLSWIRYKAFPTDEKAWEFIADRLLDDGVIVPPVKVGDKVYYPSASFGRIFEKTVDEILMSDKGNYIHFASTYMPFENIGKTVFLTREQTEKALEGKGE